MAEPNVRTFVIDTTSLPLGVHDLIQFNGFVFNDPWALERAKLSSLDGVMDSDLRDQREELPDADGELYRAGRTVVLEGMLRAGNAHSLLNLRQELKAALASRTEKELWFNRYDLVEDFSSTTKFTDRYSFDTGSGTLAPSGGELVPSSTTTKRIYYNDHTYLDVQATIKLLTGSTVGGFAAIVLCRKDSTNFLWCYFAPATGLIIIKREAGADTNLATLSTTFTANTNYWLRGRKDGNVITCEVFTSDPVAGSAPSQTLTHTLTGGDITNFGAAVYGNVGLNTQPNDTAWRYDDFEIDGINPCDLVLLDVRRAGSLNGAERVESLEYKRPFQVSLRAADPLFYSRYQDIRITTPTQSLALGTLFNLSFPVNFNTPLDSNGAQTSTSAATIENIGDEDSPVTLILKGSMDECTVTNLTNGQILTFTGQVTAGTDITIDCRTWDAEDSAGNDRSGDIYPGSARLALAPGNNVLAVTSLAFDATARVHIISRSAWA